MNQVISLVPFPRKVLRGKRALEKIGPLCSELGTKIFILGGKTALTITQEVMSRSLGESNLSIVGQEWYGGECSYTNQKSLEEKIKISGADLIITVGGGKAMDTGKLVAVSMKLPLVTVPTIAATCASMASVSVVYNDQGQFVDVVELEKCPDGIVIDTDIIAKAPVRWLAAGLGDTLAKWYEYRVSILKAPKNGLTLGALANGRLCYDLIKEFGGAAMESAKKGEHSEAVDSAVDAIILYAGTASLIGGTTVRAVAAHAFYNGLTQIPASHGAGHGLTVGYGNLVLLAIEERSDEEVLEAIELARACGVPTQLKEIVELSEEEKEIVAEAVLNNPDMQSMPFEVTKEMLWNAVERVDRLAGK